jgi:hypothetical protein
MLDEFARRLIQDASLPAQLTGEYARDLISRSYLHWLATGVLGTQPPFLDAENYPETLSEAVPRILSSHMIQRKMQQRSYSLNRRM